MPEDGLNKIGRALAGWIAKVESLMIKKITFILSAAIILVFALFYFLTLPISYEVKPDENYRKAHPTDIKRPFHVDRDEYPFASHWLNYKGAKMHYLDEGEGIPVVLCHGNPTWSFLYRNIIKAMKGQARFIAHDLPGLGFSGTPKNFDFKPKTHSQYVEHFLLNELQLEKFIMVVQDWGGPTCLNIAANNPDKVLGLVISNTWAWPVEGRLNRASNFIKTAPVQRLIINRNGMGNMLMNSMLPEMDNRSAVLRAYSHAFPTPESRRPTATFPIEIARSHDWLAEIESRLPALQDKPVEFIFGMADHETMSDYNINKWKHYFPNAEIQVVEDAKHFTQEDTPESFVTALNRLLKTIEDDNVTLTTLE